MAGHQQPPGPKRVLIVGAGAAGMSCAHHLAEHPDRFDVTVVEAADYCGGQAFSIPLDKARHGAAWLNQGVQGGSFIFHHTMTMFARQGFAANPVRLHVSFGQGDRFWTNVYPTRLLARHAREIRRFARMLRIVRRLEAVFALLPISLLMRLFAFSREFTNAVALPMVALFLGTGNATPEVPSVILERLCTSPTYGMWYPPDDESIASNQPPMVVFPHLSRFYEAWRKDLVNKGVSIRLSTEVTKVVRRDKNGVTVRVVKRTPTADGHNPSRAWTPEDTTANADADAEETTEDYDEIVFCCLADTTARLLSSTASLRERFVLGRTKFSNDLTITHTDAAYMQRNYETVFSPSQAAPSLSASGPARVAAARQPDGFRPMYFTHAYASDPAKLEMAFDCTRYQAQFPATVADLDRHVFQTIFLNRERDGHLWTDGEIDPACVVRKDWWHQLCHAWTHYVLVVPWLWLLQGRCRTRLAGSWTLVNAHETAVMSGIAAAVDLGAEYPRDLERDRFALLCFRLYYLLVYGRWYRRRGEEGEEGEGSGWGTGLNGSVYCGPGVTKAEREMWREENGGVKWGGKD